MEKKRDFKKDFEAWAYNNGVVYMVNDNGAWYSDSERFEDLPKSMQWGVMVDFFDSIGVVISIDANKRFNVKIWSMNKKHEIIDIESREEAREKALEKAKELYEHG